MTQRFHRTRWRSFS